MISFDKYMQEHKACIDEVIERVTHKMPMMGQNVAKHITSSRGKAFRPGLLLLTAEALGCHAKKAYPLAAAIELIHCATLLHDDIEDAATLRRGLAPAHKIFGEQGTILSGDAMLAMAIVLSAGEGSKAISLSIADAIFKTVCGQMQELAKAKSLTAYIVAISQKTGALMGAACEIGAILAKADKDTVLFAKKLGVNLGIAYQLLDDLLDFYPSSQTGKTRACDLIKGNLTLPLRFYANSLPKSQRSIFVQKLYSGKFNSIEQEEIINAVLAPEIHDQIKNFTERYLTETRKYLALLPESKEKLIFEQIITAIQQNLHRGHNAINKF